MDPHDALLRLVACGGPLAPRRALLDAAGGDPAAALADTALWADCGLDAAQRDALRRPDGGAMSAAHDWLAHPANTVVGWHDADYPPALRDAPSPPLALFVSGDPALLWRPAVAVVGTRGPTPGGREHAADFARAFARAGLVVGSGLAAGIDTAAHQAALDAPGDSFAVLGTGPDVVYPRSNAHLHARLAAEGALVSEHLPGTGPRREHFPSRNRLLAALCLGTVVIEAAERSGALITARLAAEAGREVFAVPGSIRNPLARGCHRLIRDGAMLVQSPADVLDLLGPRAACEAGIRQRDLFADGADPGATTPAGDSAGLNAEQLRLWNALGFDPTDMDQLAERTGLTPSILSPMLLGMELDGRITQQHGRFHRMG